MITTEQQLAEAQDAYRRVCEERDWLRGELADISGQDAPIRRWHNQAAQLDARAARARAGGQGDSSQIYGWEMRAQALRDCATELWQLATGDQEGSHRE